MVEGKFRGCALDLLFARTREKTREYFNPADKRPPCVFAFNVSQILLFLGIKRRYLRSTCSTHRGCRVYNGSTGIGSPRYFAGCRLEVGSYLCKVDSSRDLLGCKSSAGTSPLPAPRTLYSCCPWDRCIVPQPRLPPANRTADRSLPFCRLQDDVPREARTCAGTRV